MSRLRLRVLGLGFRVRLGLGFRVRLGEGYYGKVRMNGVHRAGRGLGSA